MRYQRVVALRTGYFLSALLLAVAMLYLLGDLAENLDKWLADGQSPLLAAIAYLINVSELLIRIGPLLVLLACLFAWTRSASLGEMTAMEAAGMHPLRHILIGVILLSLAAGLQVFYQHSLSANFARWRQMVTSYARSGQILAEGKEASMLVTKKLIVVQRPEYWEVQRDADGGPLRMEKTVGQRKQIYQVRENRLRTEPAEGIRFVEAAPPATPWITPLLWIFIFVAGLLAVAWKSVVRHGRSRGQAAAAGRTVLWLVVLWGLDQGVAPMFADRTRVFALRGAVILVLLTILWPWRTIMSKR